MFCVYKYTHIENIQSKNWTYLAISLRKLNSTPPRFQHSSILHVHETDTKTGIDWGQPTDVAYKVWETGCVRCIAFLFLLQTLAFYSRERSYHQHKLEGNRAISGWGKRVWESLLTRRPRRCSDHGHLYWLLGRKNLQTLTNIQWF